MKECRQIARASNVWSCIMPWQWLSTTGTWVRSSVCMGRFRSKLPFPTVGSEGHLVEGSRGGNEGDVLYPVYLSYLFSCRYEPRVIEWYILGIMTFLDPYEQHQLR